MPPETLLPNDPAARTPDGTIADKTALQPTSSSTDKTSSTQTTDTTATPTKTEPTNSDKSLATDAAKTEPAKEAAKAPDAYADFKVPDGYELNPDVVKEANGIFKKHGLPQEAAQEIVDFYVKESQRGASEAADFYTEKRQEWRKELVADKTLGNGKDNLSDATRASVSKTIAAMGPQLSEAFKEAMDYTGAGDNPAFVRALVFFSQFVTEGGHVAGAGPSPLGQTNTGRVAVPTAAQALYPGLPSAASGR